MNLNNKNKIKPIHVLSGVLVLFLICSGFGGNYAYKAHKSILNRVEDSLNAEITDISTERDSALLKSKESALIDNSYETDQKTYYYEYLNERSRRIKAEDEIKDIRTRLYTYGHLDSLGANIEYPKD